MATQTKTMSIRLKIRDADEAYWGIHVIYVAGESDLARVTRILDPGNTEIDDVQIIETEDSGHEFRSFRVTFATAGVVEAFDIECVVRSADAVRRAFSSDNRSPAAIAPWSSESDDNMSMEVTVCCPPGWVDPKNVE